MRPFRYEVKERRDIHACTFRVDFFLARLEWNDVVYACDDELYGYEWNCA